MLSNVILAALIILSVLVTFELIAFLGVFIVVRTIAKEITRRS